MKMMNICVAVLSIFCIVVLGGNNAFAESNPLNPGTRVPITESSRHTLTPPRPLKPCATIPVNYKLIIPPYTMPRENIYPNQTVPDGIIVSNTVQISLWEASCPSRCSLPNNTVNEQCLPPTFAGMSQGASKYMFPLILDIVDCGGMEEGPNPNVMCEQ